MGKKKSEKLIKDMYDELTRLKSENEKLRKKLGEPIDDDNDDDVTDTSTIMDVVIDEKDKGLTEDDLETVNLAIRFQKLLDLSDEDIEKMKKELKYSQEERKKEFRRALETRIIYADSSIKLSDITAMELAGKKPIEILKAIYKNNSEPTEDDKLVDKLVTKMRRSLMYPNASLSMAF